VDVLFNQAHIMSIAEVVKVSHHYSDFDFHQIGAGTVSDATSSLPHSEWSKLEIRHVQFHIQRSHILFLDCRE